ncbi:ZDHC4 palmitoyltransferase, partial [Nothocercus nigrocapillus]|nr:ZDHC4 palmitoyltransferase [Nothocercus nigrocapillus]
MDFLTLFLIYLCFVLATAALICLCSGSRQGRLARSAHGAAQVLSFVIPTELQRMTQKVLHRLFHTRYFTSLNLLMLFFANVSGSRLLPASTVKAFLSSSSILSLSGVPAREYRFPLRFVVLFSCCSLLIVEKMAPCIVTKSNHTSLIKIYAYDAVLFQKGIVCPTCNMEKPARSKHCGLCNICVHRFDHHCVWVNNCIGAFNTKYFFLYLFTLTGMAASIALITVAFFIQVVLLSNMMHGSYIDDQGQEQGIEILFLIQHLFLTFPRVVFMLGFVILLTLVLGAYCCFNLYLALTNQTSNEWYKSRRFGCSHHQASQPQDRRIIYRNIYSNGIWMNLKEIFKPPMVLGKKKR